MSKLTTIVFCLFIYLCSLAPGSILAQAQGSPKKMGDWYLGKCNEAYNNDNLDSLIYFAQLAREQFQILEDWENYFICQNALCTAYYLSDNFTHYQKQLLSIVEDTEKYLGKQSIGFSAALSNYSVFLRELGDHEAAINNLEKVLEIEKGLEDDEAISITLGNLGINYFRKGDFGEALNYYTKVITMGIQDDSLMTATQWSNAYNKIGITYFAKLLPDSAIVYFKKSLQKHPEPKNDLGDVAKKNKIDANLFLADAYLFKKQKKEVQYYIDQALDLSDDKHYLYRGDAYEILARLYQNEKKYKKAIDYLLKSKAIAKKIRCL